MAGQVFAIASGKGGVGKTTTVVNLGVVLRRADHSVALVDADLGMANLGPMLGVSGELTLHDVLSGRATVEEALAEEAPGFAVLPGSGSLTDYPDADPRNLAEILDTLAESYDFVLVDTGAGMSHEDVLPLGLADGVVLVASPDPAAIGDTRKTAELVGLARGSIVGLVVTKADSDTDAEQVASEIGIDLLGVIPYDSTVRQSTASGRPLEATDPDTPAAAGYRELASRLVEAAADLPTRSPSADAAAGDMDGFAGSEPTGDADAVATDEPVEGGGGHEGESSAPGSTGEPDAAESPDAGAEQTSPTEPEPTPTTQEGEPTREPDEVEPETEQSEPTEEAADEPAEVDDETPEETTETAEAADETPDETSEAADGADDEPAEADDETPEETTESAEAVDGADDEPTEDDATEDDAEEEEDYLAEFEDDEPESKGGLLSRIGRLFR